MGKKTIDLYKFEKRRHGITQAHPSDSNAYIYKQDPYVYEETPDNPEYVEKKKKVRDVQVGSARG